jgi:SAM-dependent methyltransferase
MKTKIFKTKRPRKKKQKVVVLGCAFRKPKGAIGIDIRPFEGVDHVLDLEKDILPFEDNSIDVIKSDHIFEHLGDGFLFCIDECFRVLKPTGVLEISVPNFPGKGALIHPDHKRFFIPDTFGFFHVPSDGIDVHGYLKGFWHIDHIEFTDENIACNMTPNKPGGKYNYVKVKRKDGQDINCS